MATDCIYGLYKNGELKTGFNGCDSYPSGFGKYIVCFIRENTIEELHELYNQIRLYERKDEPNDEQLQELRKKNIDVDFGREEGFNWEMISIVNRGFLNYYKYGVYFMVNYLDWLKRGVCWAYIINLDENTFEVYERNWHHKDEDIQCNKKKLCDDKYILKGAFDLKQIPKTWNNDVD